MEEVTEKIGMQVPMLLISDDGHVTIQGVYSDNEPLLNFLNYGTDPHAAKETADESHRNELLIEKEMLVNEDVNNEVLEQYMEVFVTYRCKECAFVTTDQKEFQEHCLEHLMKESSENSTDNTTYVYLCSSCSRAFNSPEETKQHMIKEHELKNNMNLDDSSENVKTINVSIETTDGKEKETRKKKRKSSEIIQSLDPSNSANNFTLPCTKRNCNVKFSNEKNLAMHESCHVYLEADVGNYVKNLYQCFKCNELFNNWHGCSSHLFKAHEIDCDLLKCPICETYRTSKPLWLENHIRIHSDVRAFTCKHCGKTFKQASQLRNHVIVHADKESANKPVWSRSAQCNICYKMYSDSKSLKKHKEEVHSKLRPFVCNICGHASARKSMLAMHQRQHTGQKPYECRLCNYKTADHNCLRKHIMRHTGVRPYKCPYCEYTAIQSGSFKNHMKQVHPEKDGMFVCNICMFKTVSEDNHVRHISDHLTGLIKDKGATEKEAGMIVHQMIHSSDNQHKLTNQIQVSGSNFIVTDIFRGKSIIEDSSLELKQTEYQNCQNTDEDLIDTGGITIPADPHCNTTQNNYTES